VLCRLRLRPTPHSRDRDSRRINITLPELALETFFAADELTAQRMRAIAGSR
jgi:hypothetical protein